MSECESMYLYYFTQEKDFPFFIQDGHHDTPHKRHRHEDFVELTIVLDGSAMQSVNDHSYYIKRGDVFVFSSDVTHQFFATNKLHICNIMFRPEFVFEHAPDIRQIPGFHALFIIEPLLAHTSSYESYLQLNFHQFEQVRTLIHALYEEYHAHRPGRHTMVLSYFYQLATLLSRAYKLPQKEADNYSSFCIARSVSYMEENFRKDISIHQLAEMSHLSDRHFSRLFASVYHTSPHNYLMQLRLETACSLLETAADNLSITEIALDCGFANNAYFSRLFRSIYGMTPRQYRSLHTTLESLIPD